MVGIPFTVSRSRRQATGRHLNRVRNRPLALELLEDRRVPSASSTRFAIFGDYGTGQQQEQDVANLVHSWNPDFVVTTGDNNYTTPPLTAASYDTVVGQFYHDFISPYSGSYGAGATTNRFWPTMGEHDWGAIPNNPTGDQGYLNFFTGVPGNKRYYTVTQGPVALFVLDTDGNEPDGTSSISKQAQWLQGALASSTAPWKLVFMSFPAYSSGDFGATGGLQWPFQAWGASAIFAGHDHDYERMIENGMPYFVEGTGGAGLEKAPSSFIAGSQAFAVDWGAIKVDASSSQITFSFINRAGTVLDTYTMKYALPAAPSNLTATAVSGTQINLKWTDNSSNETGYAVERSTDGTNFTPMATAGPATTGYLDSGLITGTAYYYRVAAFNAGGNSAYANTANAIPSALVPPANPPTSLTATVASASKVNLVWTDNSAGLYNFQIERSTDGSTYSLVATAPAGVTSYADTGLAPATYYYQIVATTVLGANRGSTAVAGAVLAPAAPGNLSAVAVSVTQINLKWTNNASNAAGIKILRSTDGTNFTQIAVATPITTHYLDSGLSTGIAYYYRVVASNAAGNSANSNTANTTIPSSLLPPVGAPTNLTATVASASKVNLGWTDNSTGLYSFQIERSTDGSTYALVGTVGMGVTSYADAGLAPATYYYHVVGTTALGGNMGATAVVGAVLAPAAPGNLSVTAVSGTQINLKWTNNAANAAGINILRSVDGTNFTQIATAGSATTNYLDAELASGTPYYYRVAATNASGSSAYSNISNATIQAPVLPPIGPPTNATASVASASQVNLAWTDNSGGLYSFQIERSTDGSVYSLVATVGMGVTSYADTGLAAATYYYQVVASSSPGGNRGSSAVVAAALAPAAPGNLTATAFFSRQINLTWTNNASNATGFNILQSTDGVNFTSIATVGVNTTSFSNYFLTPASTYYYRISAVNPSGASPLAAVRATTTPRTPPLAASNLTAVAVDTRHIKLSWTDNSNPPNVQEDGFALYRSDDGLNFKWTQSPGRDLTTYEDPDSLSPGTTYYFQMIAFNVDGFAAPSNMASATTMSLPAAPSNLTATALSGTQVSLSWTDNSASGPTVASGFKLYRSIDQVTWTWFASTGQGVTSYTWGGGSPSTTYYFYVTASSSLGDSAASNTTTATTLGIPAAPSTLTATAVSTTQINLSWTDNSVSPAIATSFKVYRSTDNVTFNWFATTGQGVTTYSWFGGSPGTTYYFDVKASNVAGDSSPSNTATATTVGLPASPSNLTAAARSSSQVDLAWTDNSGTSSTNPLATSFKLYRSTDQSSWSWFAAPGQGATSYTWFGGSASTTYYFYIAASVAAGDSGPSNTSSATTTGATPSTAPAAPGNLALTVASSSQINLSWTSNDTIQNGFNIFRSTDGTKFTQIATTGASITSYQDAGLSASTTYYYEVNAYDSVGVSAYSNIANATTPPRQDSRHLPGVGQSESALPNVSYHGGPLLQHVQVESIYAGQAWSSDPSLQQQMRQLDGFLSYFVTSPYVGALQQYGVSYGAFLGHDLAVQDSSAGRTIDDSQIRALLDAEIAAHHVAAPTANQLYVLFTAPGVVVTDAGQNSITDFAGYHDVFTDSRGNTVYYAVVPYPTGAISAAPLTAMQQATVVLSHEVSEAMTDPDTRSGWFDPRLGEIGDITEEQIGVMHGYTVQAVWSQADGQGVIPAGATATTLQMTTSQGGATASPLRNMLATIRGADAKAASASFVALFTGHDSTSPTGSQDSTALLTVQASQSGAAFAPSRAVAVPSVATATVVVVPSDSTWATSLRPAQDARNDSGGDNYLPQTLEDALPAAGSALPREEAFPPAAESRIEQEFLPALQSDAALWREASTVYFTKQGAADGPAERGVPALLPLAVPHSSVGGPGAAAAVLALLLGSYRNPLDNEPTVRARRPARRVCLG